MLGITFGVLGVIVLILAAFGIRVVQQTHRGVVEQFGRFNRICQPGLNLIIPIIETMHYRNMTERLADVEPQDIITKDNLNAKVDLQVYYKVKNTEDDIKASYYNVDDFKRQIISIAQTTARNVIGDMKFIEVNSKRNELNWKLKESIDKQIESWGVDVVRVELKEITPPKEVQATMNQVIQAQNAKDAALDIATAAETKADGERRASIKVAEGVKQAAILKAEGEAEAIKLVNEAAEKHFKGNAQLLKKLETVERSLAGNSKIIVPQGQSLVNVIGGLAELTSANGSH